MKYKSGTGIIDAWGRPAIVLSPLTRGLGALSDGDPNTRPDDFIGVCVQYDDGSVANLTDPLSYRMETFREYLSRPTGLGKWPWAFVYIYLLFSVCICVWSLIGGGLASILVPAGMVLLNAAILFGHYMNYTQQWN